MPCDLTPDDFDALVRELARLNALTADAAGDYLAAIGDTPEVDAEGRVIVRGDDGTELARLRWPEEEDDEAPEGEEDEA